MIGEMAMGVRDADSPDNCNVLERGELDKPGAEVPRGVLTVLKTQASAQIPPRHSGRLELARWIASKDNPLTARVMVNRVWEHLFGQGLVDTVDNFGALGNEPSNPELLDMLAVQFIEDKWSVKRLDPLDRPQPDLSTGQPAQRGQLRKGSGQSPAVADGAAPVGRRGDPRCHVGGQRTA